MYCNPKLTLGYGDFHQHPYLQMDLSNKEVGTGNHLQRCLAIQTNNSKLPPAQAPTVKTGLAILCMPKDPWLLLTNCFLLLSGLNMPYIHNTQNSPSYTDTHT